MCGCVLTDQTYNWWKNWAHVFLSLCVHRILEFGFCEVSLSCNLKLSTSHFVQLQNLELWENPGDFCIVLWFLLGNGGFISVTACITQPQVSYSICVNCWLKTISLPTLQMTAVFPTFFFFLFLVLAEYAYNKDSKFAYACCMRKSNVETSFLQKPGGGPKCGSSGGNITWYEFL